MTERTIILLVVVALLGVAFFFPYENTDGYTPGAAAQRQPGDDKGNDLGPQAVPGPAVPPGLPDPTAPENDPLSPQTFTGGRGQSGGAWSPAAGNAAAARRAEATAIATKLETRKGGFGENVKLEGAYVCQLVDVPDADPPEIVFHHDGTFADHRFLSARARPAAGASTRPGPTPAVSPGSDWRGTYHIHGFTLELVVAGDPAPTHVQATISPVGDDEDLTRPQKLYIEGKILRLKR